MVMEEMSLKESDERTEKMIKTVPEFNDRPSPIVESEVKKSRDGRWIIHRTIITDIKPAAYYSKVLN